MQPNFSIHFFLALFHLPVPESSDRQAVTGRTVAELEVHTKKFYSLEEWKKISSMPLDLTKSPRKLALSSVYFTSLTPESPYMDTYMKDFPSVCKHGNF